MNLPFFLFLRPSLVSNSRNLQDEISWEFYGANKPDQLSFQEAEDERRRE
jgi:hypothetical protein